MCERLHDYAGTKNVAKQMKKVSTGTKKNVGKTWFAELSDKRMFLINMTPLIILLLHLLGKSTKVHLYYCMKNCAQSASHLRNSTLNIVQHYQVSYGCTAHMCTCT